MFFRFVMFLEFGPLLRVGLLWMNRKMKWHLVPSLLHVCVCVCVCLVKIQTNTRFFCHAIRLARKTGVFGTTAGTRYAFQQGNEKVINVLTRRLL